MMRLNNSFARDKSEEDSSGDVYSEASSSPKRVRIQSPQRAEPIPVTKRPALSNLNLPISEKEVTFEFQSISEI